LPQLDKYVEVKQIEGNVMKLRYTTKSLGQIGYGFHSKASS